MDGVVLLVVLFSLQIQVKSQLFPNSNMSCSGITPGSKHVVSDAKLLKKPAQGMNLKICPSNLTCCSKQVEIKLHDQISRLLKDTVQMKVIATRDFLTAQTYSFDDFFKNLLKKAQLKWHNMLLLTYKQRYQANRDIFNTFFSSLEQYYTLGNINLTDAIDVFFKELQNRVLVMLYPGLSTQQGFLNCISENIDVIKPFGKMRTRVTSQLKSSLSVARTFIEALKVACNVTDFLISKLPTSYCLEDFSKIPVCPICQGSPNVKVCKRTCENVLHSCSSSLLTTVDNQWNDYLLQLHHASLLMEGQYNFEAVAGTLSYDVSTAIMNLQANQSIILKKAHSICKTNSGKTKRAVDSSGNDFYLEGSKRRKRDSYSLPKHFGLGNRQASAQPVKSLGSLTSDFRKHLSGMNNIWSALPNEICKDHRFVSQGKTTSCWNGIGLQSNSPSVPALKSTNNRTDSQQSIQAQLNVLKITQEKIKAAIQHGHVSYVRHRENIDDDGSASASGSGDPDQSGSGTEDPSSVKSISEVLGDGVDTTNATSTSSVSTISSSTTSSVSTTEDVDMEGSSTFSGSGSASGSIPTDVTEMTTKVTNPREEEDLPMTDVGQTTEPNVKVLFLKTDPSIHATTNNEGKTSFSTNGLMTHFCLFLSAFVLYLLE